MNDDQFKDLAPDPAWASVIAVEVNIKDGSHGDTQGNWYPGDTNDSWSRLPYRYDPAKCFAPDYGDDEDYMHVGSICSHRDCYESWCIDWWVRVVRASGGRITIEYINPDAAQVLYGQEN